jgi:predicted DNA-binding transcriptional regulator AlpA
MALMRQEQVAAMLQLSPSTLEDWRWKRIGPPFVRISRGCIRYEESEVTRWIESHRVSEIRRA